MTSVPKLEEEKQRNINELIKHFLNSLESVLALNTELGGDFFFFFLTASL